MTVVHPCNCSTCSSKCEDYKNHELNDKMFGTSEIEDLEYFTQNHGCLFHPKVREYLMKDEIAELERLKQHAINGLESHDDFKIEWDWRIKAFEEAIKLLKDVKK